MDCRSEQIATLAARIFISLHLALVYLKSLPELGLALPMQRKKLSDVILWKVWRPFCVYCGGRQVRRLHFRFRHSSCLAAMRTVPPAAAARNCCYAHCRRLKLLLPPHRGHLLKPPPLVLPRLLRPNVVCSAMTSTSSVSSETPLTELPQCDVSLGTT